MDRKTARKYRFTDQLPSQRHEQMPARDWRTRDDPFAEVWNEVAELLEQQNGWEAKTLFEELQRRHPGCFADGQLRTLQRHVKQWRATHGPDGTCVDCGRYGIRRDAAHPTRLVHAFQPAGYATGYMSRP